MNQGNESFWWSILLGCLCRFVTIRMVHTELNEFEIDPNLVTKSHSARTPDKEFSHEQATALLVDCFIVPSLLRNDILRSCYRYRHGFTIDMIHQDMGRRYYLITREHLLSEMRLFFHRNLIKTLRMRQSDTTWYHLSNPRKNNPIYQLFFQRNEGRFRQTHGQYNAVVRMIRKKKFGAQ